MVANGTEYGFDCQALSKFPLEGSEVVHFAWLFMILICLWALVYADVVVKQWAPSKYLDPKVWARIQSIQKAFPNLVLSDREKSRLYDTEKSDNAVHAEPAHEALLEDGTTVKYDEIRAAESYISGKTIDLDLMIALANNSAYCTMSGYSAATTRGYNMLSLTLATTGFATTALCLHNFLVNPRAGEAGWLGVQWGLVALYTYPFIICTSIVMTTVGSTVWRQSNIMLWTNAPYHIGTKKNPLLSLHVAGVAVFGLCPVVAHLVQLSDWGESTVPNYHTAMSLISMTVLGLATFGVAGLFGTKWLPCTTRLTGKKLSITGEWVMMLSAFITFIHWETYPTMYCTNSVASFNKLLFGAFFAPFACIAKAQLWAPNDYTVQPALMLTYKGEPVALAGPCPAEAWHGDEYQSAAPTVQKRLPHAVVLE